MANIFNAKFDTHADGEFFWHATTIKNVFTMIANDSGGLKAIGTGQMGDGFYVTGTRSDYQKAMARRAREDGEEAPLFLFYVRVKGFYALKPVFSTRWDTSSAGDADFSAVSWYRGGPGGAGMPEPGGFIPAATGNRLVFKYGEYRQNAIPGTEIADMPEQQKLPFLETLWKYASQNTYPTFGEVEQFGKIAATLPTLGARELFPRVLLELAFKSESSLANSAIVGVKVFSPTIEPIKLRFAYKGKTYDLTPAVTDPGALRTGNDLMNFNDEVWLDLDRMITILTTP